MDATFQSIARNARKMRVECLHGICPPPVASKRRVGGFCAAIRRIPATTLAAVVFAALWVANDAVSTAMDARHDVERERAEEKAAGTTPELRKAVAALLVAAARRVNAVNEIAPTEATAAAISKVAALVEEYKLVASQFKGKKKEGPAPEPEPAQ